MNNNQRYYHQANQNYQQQQTNGNYPQRWPQVFRPQHQQMNQQQINNHEAAYYNTQQQPSNSRRVHPSIRFPHLSWKNNRINSQNYQQQQPKYQQKYPGKRSHDQVEMSSASSSASTSSNRNETSPAPKRLLQKQNSTELPAMQMLAPATPQQLAKLKKKKQAANSPAKLAQNAKDAEWKEVFTHTLSLLEGCQPGEEVAILLTYLQPTRSTWNTIKDQIYSDMQNLMTPLGVSNMLVFGSTLTGLDFKGSDLDYHISLNYQPANEEEVKQILNRALKLARYSGTFRVIYSILHARVPIIRIVHNRTDVTCDINFTSPFGYYNSQFIGTVLSFDSRIKELAVILKLWSKSNKIAEKMIMSNYCLVMLLIFYLQNLPQPMLDSIKNNQTCGRTQILDEKYRWNFFFNDRINKSKQNTQTTRQLLEGFFEFYHKLNFGDYIVCLYNGDLIARKEFEVHPDLQYYRDVVAQSELPIIKFDNPETFIIQDGFEQNLNIGIKSKKPCETFFTLVKMSHEKCAEVKAEPMSTLLIKLFTDLKFPENEKETKNESKAKKKFQMTIHSTAGDLKLCQDILVSKDKTKICSVQDQQAFYFDHVFAGTKRFLEEIYLCSVIHEVNESQQIPMKKEFKLVLNVDTVNGRKKINFKDDASILSEIKISRLMCDKKIRMDLDAAVKISSKDNGKTVDIEMFDAEVQKKSALPNFGTYFAVNISPALKYYLKKSWEDSTQSSL